MNFSLSETSLGRQRCGQWSPLITQQLRLRHVYQISALNLEAEKRCSFYFTLHMTSMSSPFYTSEKVSSINPKWPEIVLKDTNTASSCVVIRIWSHDNKHQKDTIVLTWGVHFSGLAYLGNKIADILPCYFKPNTVIFYMLGSYFTSHYYIKTNCKITLPFSNNLNVLTTLKDRVIYRRVAIQSNRNEVQPSYNLERLRKLQNLQLEIKNKTIELQQIKEKINNLVHSAEESDSYSSQQGPSSSEVVEHIRYAPQLLTMNSLNKMLHEKPTKFQRQEMLKVSKKIEIGKFRTNMLTQERNRMQIILKKLKCKLNKVTDENEERNSDLMENYHLLSKEAEKLREYKKSLIYHKELLTHVNSQLQHRRRQLLQELLFIYPIGKIDDDKYAILCRHLPNSDILADSMDGGISVALGYVTHTLVMCSVFLQVPLRYPMTHYGSRSYITDQVSASLPDKDRDFPLYTKGKEKVQFSYAVYLLNKNIAQLRWLFYLNTNDLKATLPNLLALLTGARELSYSRSGSRLTLTHDTSVSTDHSDNLVSLSSLRTYPHRSDKVIDSFKREMVCKTSQSGKNSGKEQKRGRGLSEILAIPEAYLNKQISMDSFRNYMSMEKMFVANRDIDPKQGLIKIKHGLEESDTLGFSSEPIEEGTDPLECSTTVVITRPIRINSQEQLGYDERAIKQERRISRSVGSYSDEDTTLIKSQYDLGSEPSLNMSIDTNINSNDSNFTDISNSVVRHEFLEKWSNAKEEIRSSSDSLHSPDILACGIRKTTTPLTARTDKLLTTTSFNLVKTKIYDDQ